MPTAYYFRRHIFFGKAGEPKQFFSVARCADQMNLTDVVIQTFSTPQHALETYRIFVSAKNLALDELLTLPSVCCLINNRSTYFEKVDSYRWKLFILR